MSNSADSQINQLRESLGRWNQSHQNNNTHNTSAGESARSFFSSWTDTLNERANDVYQRLPLTNQDLTTEEPSWFTLSRWERLTLFVCFILGSAACFTICIFLFPVLAVKPRKFALLWTMGSLLFVLAFGIMMGPVAYFKHISSRERLPFTLFFFFSCFATVYFAAISKSTIMTLIFAIIELVAVLYYAISYFPMGSTGLRMLSSFGVNTARGALHI
ncbi:protein transport protein Sft2p [Monosporozyma unispora]|nr:protein transport protein sft2 [Kazachstania unispora]